MTEINIKQSTRPDFRLEIFYRTYEALLNAQKAICLTSCVTLDPDEHSTACGEINSVLLEAEAVLAQWMEE